MNSFLGKFVVLVFLTTNVAIMGCTAQDQDNEEMEPEDTEVWEPVPEVVTPGESFWQAPSDAIRLFDGEGLSAWEAVEDGSEAGWEVEGDHFTVVPGTGDIRTKEGFGSVQLHIEWRTPEEIEGEGQGRGNSGIFLQGRYELQVLDSYENETYSNGMAGSIYKQHIPLMNAAKGPGEWQSYDIIFTAPEFAGDGSVESPARMTVFWNGVLVQNNVEIEGPTEYIGYPEYEEHSDREPIILQDHSNPVSFRNIWLRELD